MLPTSLDTSISSIPFDPLSPSPSDTIIDSSDSESDQNDSTRAAKRSSIEQVVQEYLKGRPPYIFTATLNGPFDDGWANPWRNARKEALSSSQKDSKAVLCSQLSLKPMNKPAEPVPSLPLEASTFVLGTDSYLSHSSTTKRRNPQISADWDSQHGAEHGSSKLRSASSSDVWLKKDKTPLRRLNIRPRSPSPSPSGRLDGLLLSQRHSELSQRNSPSFEHGRAFPVQTIRRSTPSFTAINVRTSSNPTTTTKHSINLAYGNSARKSRIREADLALDSENLPESDKPLSEKSFAVHMSANTFQNIENTEFRPHKNGHRAACCSTVVDAPFNFVNTSFSGYRPLTETKFPTGNNSTTPTEGHHELAPTCNTLVSPLSQRSRDARIASSTLPEQDSETIPAAQIVPPMFTPPLLTPSTSADLLQFPFNRNNDNPESNDSPSKDDLRNSNQSQTQIHDTQEPTANNPLLLPTEGFQREHSPRAIFNGRLRKRIKPFHSFHESPRAKEPVSKRTQLKNIQFKSYESNETPRPDQQTEGQQLNNAPWSSENSQNGIISDIRATTGLRNSITPASCPAAVLPQEDSHSNHNSAAPLPVTSMSTTYVPMSGLTDLSTQPDGQGLLQQRFDLMGALEEADSFLQTWDIERDRQLLRESSKAANEIKSPS